MCQFDRSVYEEARALEQQGLMPPLLVKQDDIQGFLAILSVNV